MFITRTINYKKIKRPRLPKNKVTSEINSDDDNENISKIYQIKEKEDIEDLRPIEEHLNRVKNIEDEDDENEVNEDKNDFEYISNYFVKLSDLYAENTNDIEIVYNYVLNIKCAHYKKFLNNNNEFEFINCSFHKLLEDNDSNTLYNILPRVNERYTGIEISTGLEVRLPTLKIVQTDFKIFDNVGKVNRDDILKNIILRIDPNDTVVDKINIKLDLLINYIRKTFFLYNLYYSNINTFDIRDLANYKNIDKDIKLLSIKNFISIFPVNFNKKEELIKSDINVKLEFKEDGITQQLNFYNGDNSFNLKTYKGNMYETYLDYKTIYDKIFFSFFLNQWKIPLTNSNKILVKFYYDNYKKLDVSPSKFHNLFASRDITTENLNNNIDLIVFILNLNFYNNLPNYGNFKSFTYISECEENLKKNNNIVIYI